MHLARDSQLMRAFLIALLSVATAAFSAIVPAHAADASSDTSATAQKPPRLPTSAFAAKPVFSTPLLSPDGKRFVYRDGRGGKTSLSIVAIDGMAVQATGIPEKVDLEWFRWAGNDRILLSVSKLVDYFGEEARRTYLLSYDLKSLKFDFVGIESQGLEGDDLLYTDPDGAYVLMGMQKTIYDYPSVLRFDLTTGKATTVVPAKSPIWEWYSDSDGVVRLGVGYENGKYRYYYRSADGGKFDLVAKVGEDDDETALSGLFRLIGGSDEGYILSDEKTGRMALYRYNYLTREIGEMVYGHDQYDIDDFWLDDDGKTLEAVTFTGDADQIVWFDPAAKRTQSMINKALPGQGAGVISSSRDDSRQLVMSSATDRPGDYYLLEGKTLSMSFLAERMAGLPPEHLAEMEAVEYQARDGLTIPAYLTLPKGRAAKGLPLIIMPHGGPYGIRDQLNYDAEVQFYANRGYAVLQPNYRGSGGYGTEFGDAGNGQIGRAMQDDLDDGMDWLVGQGIVDAKRVCVSGASYGGYAALWAVTRNPERYRCGISMVGVTDWVSMLKYDRNYLRGKTKKEWMSRVGGDNPDQLAEVSPLKKVAQLTRPVLIGHGEDDSRVPVSQAKKMKSALEKAGNSNFSYIVYKDEGHGLQKPANREDWYNRLDAFLTQHNPAD
jgi:dipeptidyl aminopeptidase/acylaminoacyl peptidase